MTVQKLIDLLAACPKDAEVIVSKDGEGNAFYSLYQVSKEPMRREGRGYEYDDSVETDSIVLWPAG